MQIKTFKGNYYQIGKEMGKEYKKNGMSFDKTKFNNRFYKNQLAIYKKYYPQLIDELTGIADGGGFDREKVFSFFTTIEIDCYRNWFALDKACTIFGYKKQNKLYVGRNYDWQPRTIDFFKTYKIINPESNSYIAVTDGAYGAEAGFDKKKWFYNVDDAVNDKGLFIGLTFAYSDQYNYGIGPIFMTKYIAENCNTVDQAIKAFKEIPVCCPKNFFIADKSGNMAVIEHNSKEFKILFPKDNILIQTNHYLDKELAKSDTVLKWVPYHNTFIRYYETYQRIIYQKKQFNIKSISGVINKKNTYTYQNFKEIKTIWTLAFEMTEQKYQIYWDHFTKRKSKFLKV